MEKITLLPFMIGKKDGSWRVPLGDALLTLPIAREGGFRLFLPVGIVADLVKTLSDVELVPSWGPDDLLLYPSKEVFSPANPYFLDNWGTPEFLAKHGRINATLCWAKAIGMELADPVPKLRRPSKPIPKKLALFPTGAAQKRSLPEAKTAELAKALSDAGFAPEICPHFDKAQDFAAFVSSCEYAVGVYTGPMHLAAAMGVKTVALPVGDSPWAYRPLQPNVKVIAGNCDLCWTKDRRNGTPYCKESMPKCVALIKPAKVIESLNGLDEGKGGIEILPD